MSECTVKVEMSDEWIRLCNEWSLRLDEIERRLSEIDGKRSADDGPWLTLTECCQVAGLTLASLKQRMNRSHGPLKWDVVRYPNGEPMPGGTKLVREVDLMAELTAHPVQGRGR